MSFGHDIGELVEKNAEGLVCRHESWQRIRLGDIAKLVNGFAFKSKFFSEQEGAPLVRIRDVVPGRPGTFYNAPVDDPKMSCVSDGEIAIGMDGDFNCRIWKGGKALLNQRVCTLTANVEFYSQKLLAFALPAYLKLINEHTSSVTVKHLSSRTVQDIPLPLPPLSEQHRIVKKIETLFAQLDKGEEAVREVQKLLNRYRQSILKSAVTGELTGSGCSDWEQLELGVLLSDIRYGTSKKCGVEPSGTAVLRIPNVVGGAIDLGELKYTELNERETEKLSLECGDILIVRSNGSANLVARGAVVDEKAEGMAFAGYLIRLRVDQARILPEFLNMSLNSPQTRQGIERQARSTSGVHNINSGEVKALPVALPPKDQQAEIIEAVDEAFAKVIHLEKWCETELKRSAALRQSILKDAFSGRLVPQDPDDEPASALLERIQQSKKKRK